MLPQRLSAKKRRYNFFEKRQLVVTNQNGESG